MESKSHCGMSNFDSVSKKKIFCGLNRIAKGSNRKYVELKDTYLGNIRKRIRG
jgi:hypothetical protein